MIERTPTGDLLAALLLMAAAVALAYIALRDGRLGVIERTEHPKGFWGILAVFTLSILAVAGFVAWDAATLLLGG
jgi:hypothetical protein